MTRLLGLRGWIPLALPLRGVVVGRRGKTGGGGASLLASSGMALSVQAMWEKASALACRRLHVQVELLQRQRPPCLLVGQVPLGHELQKEQVVGNDREVNAEDVTPGRS